MAIFGIIASVSTGESLSAYSATRETLTSATHNTIASASRNPVEEDRAVGAMQLSNELIELAFAAASSRLSQREGTKGAPQALLIGCSRVPRVIAPSQEIIC